MSDTPRTTDRVVFIDGNPWVNAPFASSLEHELNAANSKIKRLEEALRRIANQDYRGNRSTESQIAFDALKEAKT